MMTSQQQRFIQSIAEGDFNELGHGQEGLKRACT
jgi:hypothetical protein